MTTDTTNSGSGRRRSRRSVRSQRVVPFQDPRIARYTFYTMCALAVVYVGAVFMQTRDAAITYAGLVPGMNRNDTLYYAGIPGEVRGADGVLRRVGPGVDTKTADLWRYRSATGSITDVTFDADTGELSRISCANDSAVPENCPSTFGIALGTGEEEMLDRLGTPDNQYYAGDTQIASYRGLGLEFALRRTVIYRISLARRPGPLSYVGNVVRTIVP